jgi:hypothetical protein
MITEQEILDKLFTISANLNDFLFKKERNGEDLSFIDH